MKINIEFDDYSEALLSIYGPRYNAALREISEELIRFNRGKQGAVLGCQITTVDELVAAILSYISNQELGDD